MTNKDITHMVTFNNLLPAFDMHYCLDYFQPLIDIKVEIGGEEYELEEGKTYIFRNGLLEEDR